MTKTLRIGDIKPNHGRGGHRVRVVELGQLGRAVAEHTLVRNRVAAINGFGPVADHLHRRGAWHAGPFEIANGGSAEVGGMRPVRPAFRQPSATRGESS